MVVKNNGLVLILCTLALAFILPFTLAESCADANSLSCPNCGNTPVDDCSKCTGYFNTDLNEKMCFDRKLFNSKNEKNHENHYPFLWNDILGAIVWFCAAGVATACGVGGGGIYVPLGIILLRFSSKPASGLSQASIFGASLGGLLLNIRNKHPDKKIRDTLGIRNEKGKIIPYEKDKTTAQIKKDEEQYLDGGSGRKFYTRPVIDYDMALFLAPMEMAGAVLGVLIQKVMPNWLFLSLAGVILGITSYKTYLKFFSAYAIDKTNRENRILIEAQDQGTSGSKSNLHPAGASVDEDLEAEIRKPGDSDRNLSHANVGAVEVDNDSTISYNTPTAQDNGDDGTETLNLRREYLEEDARQYPTEKLLYLSLLWIGLALITFLKGGKGVDSVVGVTCESGWFYALIALQFVWTIGFAAVFGLKAVKRTESRMKVNYPFHQNDVLWSRKKLNLYAGFTFGAGIVAGLIGIGGGMVLGPLMLIMGVHPRVSSATTATMIVLTSSSVAIMFVTSGLVPWEYALFYFCICITGAYIGKKYIDAYVKKTGMSSVLIGILATIIGLATIGCFIIVLLNLGKNNWCFDGFKAFCDKDKDGADCKARLLLDELLGVVPSFMDGLKTL